MKKLKKYSILLVLALLVGGSGVAQLNNSSLDKKGQIDATEIAVYPNPALDYFTITSESQVSHITINNIIGKQVKAFKRSELNRYDIASLKKGIYVVRIFDNNDQLVKALRLSKT